MKIIIPSHNRWENLHSLKFIPESFKDNVFIAVRSGEQHERYSELYKNVLPFNCNNIAEKRHAIANYFSGEFIWMLDDDCSLYNAHLDISKNVIKLQSEVNETEFYDFVEYASMLKDQCPFMIVRNQIFPRGKNYYPYRKNTWSFTNSLIDLSVLNAKDLNYTAVDHSEDVVAFLSTINAGYDTCCISKWMIKTILAGNKGGITETRTPSLIEKNAIKINSMFPNHTSLRRGYPLKTHPNIKYQTLSIRPKV